MDTGGQATVSYSKESSGAGSSEWKSPGPLWPRELAEIVDYEKAIVILKSLLEKHGLDAEEKEAVMTAIGLLSWGALGKGKTRAQKAKRDKSAEW